MASLLSRWDHAATRAGAACRGLATGIVLLALLPALVPAATLAAEEQANGGRGSAATAGGNTRISADIPVRRAVATDGPAGASPGRMVVVLTLLVALSIVVVRMRRTGPRRGAADAAGWLQRLVPRRGSEGLQIIQSVRLSPRAGVHVLRWDGRDLLVGVADGGVSLLGSRTSPAQGDRPDPSSNQEDPPAPIPTKGEPT